MCVLSNFNAKVEPSNGRTAIRAHKKRCRRPRCRAWQTKLTKRLDFQKSILTNRFQRNAPREPVNHRLRSTVRIESRFNRLVRKPLLPHLNSSLMPLNGYRFVLHSNRRTDLQQIHFRNSPHIFGIKSEFPQISLFMQIHTSSRLPSPLISSCNHRVASAANLHKFARQSPGNQSAAASRRDCRTIEQCKKFINSTAFAFQSK